ncbi:MAG: hypothetical protein GY757_28915, partial [bacterium]|nr:hypothetical protein [bacterium]
TNYDYYMASTYGGSDAEGEGYLKKINSPSGTQNFSQYSGTGNLVNYSNSRGISAQYTTNSFNEVTKEGISATGSLSPMNYSADYDYDDNGNLEYKATASGSPESALNNNYSYSYDARNNLKSETELNRGTTSYEYDDNDNLEQITDPENKTAIFSYDARDLISTVTTGTSTFGFTYDGNGNMKTSRDANGNVTQYTYDGYDRLVKVKDPLNNETVIGRAEFGNLLTLKRLNSAQELLKETVTINDPLGRMTSYTVKIPEGDDITYTYGYADGGKTVTVTDPLGRVSTVKRNDAGQVYQEIDAAGNTVDYWYEDLRGNMTRKVETEKKPDGTEETYETKYQYNAFNKIEKITDPLGNETTLTYDVKGNLTGSKDAEGNTISHKYDVFGRKIETVKHLKNGQKIETVFEYFKNNNIKSITDANGNKTSYEYDNQGRTEKITYPDTTFIEYTYDGNSNLFTIKQRNGTEVTNSYDGLNRLFHRSVSSSEEVEGTTFEDYEYDGLSRLTKAVNDFSTVEMTYDWMDSLTEEKQNGKLLKYTYDKVNNLKSIQYPNQRIIERDFDVLNRILKIKEGSNTITDFSYIGSSYRLLKKQYGNGDVIDYLYDQGKRLTSKETKNTSSALINKYVYGYNKVHMKTFEQRGHDGNKGDVYGYDEVHRLKNVKFNAPDPQNLETTQFEKSKSISFDKVDNIRKIISTQNDITSEITTTLEGTRAKLNQYSGFDSWGLSYDLNGNTTQKGTQNFYYDYKNQVVRATDNSTTTGYKYDAFGRRIEKSYGVNVSRYYYTGNRVIEERNASDQVKKQFTYGNGIDELLRIDIDESGTMVPYYIHTNAIGSVTAVTDADGNVVERASYDIYGMPTFTDYRTDPQNPTVVENSIIGNDILFQGRRYDKETNLYYYRARYYDPIMGRFLQTDPMGYRDSLNLYQAFNQNGLNFIDPMGETYYVFSEKTEGIEAPIPYKNTKTMEVVSVHENGVAYLLNRVGLMEPIQKDVPFDQLPDQFKTEINRKHLKALSENRQKKIDFVDRRNGTSRDGYNATAEALVSYGNVRGKTHIEYEEFDARTISSSSARYPSIRNANYTAIPWTHKRDTPRAYPAFQLRNANTNSNRLTVVATNPDHLNQVASTVDTSVPAGGVSVPAKIPTSYYAAGINIHRAGRNDFTGIGRNGFAVSEGCILIRTSSWKRFYDLLYGQTQENVPVTLNTAANSF